MFGGRGRSSRSTRTKPNIPHLTTTTTYDHHDEKTTGSDDNNKNNNKNKLYSRLLSRENNYPSVRVYYGEVSVAVPFTWESQPGTPKYNFSHYSSDLIPPLTPPPSYFSNSISSSSSSSSRQLSKKHYSFPNFISFLSSAVRSSNKPPASAAATSSDSSFTSYSSSSTSSTLAYRRRNTESLLDLNVSDHPPSGFGSGSGSILCFGGGSSSWRRGRYGCL